MPDDARNVPPEITEDICEDCGHLINLHHNRYGCSECVGRGGCMRYFYTSGIGMQYSQEGY
jgi:hypothetical protein